MKEPVCSFDVDSYTYSTECFERRVSERSKERGDLVSLSAPWRSLRLKEDKEVIGETMKNEDIIRRYRDLFGNQGNADQVLGSILEALGSDKRTAAMAASAISKSAR